MYVLMGSVHYPLCSVLYDCVSGCVFLGSVRGVFMLSVCLWIMCVCVCV